MKKYIGAILSLSSIGMLFYIIFDQQHQIKTLTSTKPNMDSVQYIIDSLHDENFIQHTELDRYDIAIEKLRENYPQAADQFDECLKDTE
jgi:hypothetical protein